MKKKLLSMLLVLVMVLGMFPMSAMATGTEPEIGEPQQEQQTDGEIQLLSDDGEDLNTITTGQSGAGYVDLTTIELSGATVVEQQQISPLVWALTLDENTAENAELTFTMTNDATPFGGDGLYTDWGIEAHYYCNNVTSDSITAGATPLSIPITPQWQNGHAILKMGVKLDDTSVEYLGMKELNETILILRIAGKDTGTLLATGNNINTTYGQEIGLPAFFIDGVNVRNYQNDGTTCAVVLDSGTDKNAPITLTLTDQTGLDTYVNYLYNSPVSRSYHCGETSSESNVLTVTP